MVCTSLEIGDWYIPLLPLLELQSSTILTWSLVRKRGRRSEAKQVSCPLVMKRSVRCPPRRASGPEDLRPRIGRATARTFGSSQSEGSISLWRRMRFKICLPKAATDYYNNWNWWIESFIWKKNKRKSD